ncbi:hypothetical protein EV426DRAFT_666032, partial [Tirmania nivea]
MIFSWLRNHHYLTELPFFSAFLISPSHSSPVLSSTPIASASSSLLPSALHLKWSVTSPSTFSLSLSSCLPLASSRLFICCRRYQGSLAHLTTSHGSFSPFFSQNFCQQSFFFSLIIILKPSFSAFHLFILASCVRPSPGFSRQLLCVSFSCTVKSSSHHLFDLSVILSFFKQDFRRDLSFSYEVVPSSLSHQVSSSPFFSTRSSNFFQSTTSLTKLLCPSPQSISANIAQWSNDNLALITSPHLLPPLLKKRSILLLSSLPLRSLSQVHSPPPSATSNPPPIAQSAIAFPLLHSSFLLSHSLLWAFQS